MISSRLMKIRLLTVCFALCFTVTSLHAQGLPRATPEDVGLSTERLNRIDKVMNTYINAGKMPGMVTAIARNGKIAYFKSFGKMDIESGRPMENDAIFRIASMTKAITSVAVMILYEEGNFLLSDPISKYIPEFKNPKVIVSSASGPKLIPAKSEITIRQLLNHTSGITYGDKLHKSYYTKANMKSGLEQINEQLSDAIKRLATLPLVSHPGEEFHYGLSIDVLGYLVEVVSKMPLDMFIKQRILTPLKMVDSDFNLPRAKQQQLATLYKLTPAYTLEKVDKYFPYPQQQSYFSGGAGLLSTAVDYMRFAQMLLNKGELSGVRILSRKTVELMTSNSIGDLAIYDFSEHNKIMGNKFGYGFGIRTERGDHNEIESLGSYGWDGAFYTRFWIDPSENLIGIFMSQMEYNWNENLIGKYKNLVYQSIAD